MITWPLLIILIRVGHIQAKVKDCKPHVYLPKASRIYQLMTYVAGNKWMSILDKGVAFGQSRSVLDKNVGYR